MTITQVLDQYYLAKRANNKEEQLAIADLLVEKYIPELIPKTKGEDVD